MASFNLKKFKKTAFYDDGRGYWNKNNRSFDNCYKCKVSEDGLNAHDAWMSCLDEFQKRNDSDWHLDQHECGNNWS